MNGARLRYAASDFHRDHHPQLLRLPTVTEPFAVRTAGTHQRVVGCPAAEFDLFTSQLVLDEASEGESAKASEPLELLSGLELLDITEEVEALAADLVRSGIVPSVAARDAFHLAAAGVHRMNFLLTWNCKHIANPFIADRLQSCFSSMGVHLPNICTPEQFFTDDDNDSQNQPSEGT